MSAIPSAASPAPARPRTQRSRAIFNSAYTVKTSSHAQGGAAGAAGRDTTMTLEAKWLGACKPGQKPGDIVMPGGFKMNVRDMDKLKALLPK